jgi:hypothetical protein
MFSDTIEQKKNEVRKILIESGWLKKYYYATEVLKSCTPEKTNSATVIINTRKWGRDMLNAYLDIIKQKHKDKSYYHCLLEESDIYFQQFRKVSDDVLSAFLDAHISSNKRLF